MAPSSHQDPLLLAFGPAAVRWRDEDLFWFFGQFQVEMSEYEEAITDLQGRLEVLARWRDDVWLAQNGGPAATLLEHPLALLGRRSAAGLEEMASRLDAQAAELRAELEELLGDRQEKSDHTLAAAGELVRRFHDPSSAATFKLIEGQLVCLQLVDGTPLAAVVSFVDPAARAVRGLRDAV
ncbi:hypothetical protein [Phenylobacterium sp.]|uniref:hypothetical protein n=1 Tax=Phenylobacterium sp. TaxID=1871053 RepID=UPI0035AFBB3B